MQHRPFTDTLQWEGFMMYKSRFADDIENMLRMLHNSGLKVTYLDSFLNSFDVYCSEKYCDDDILSMEIAEGWIHDTDSASQVHMSRRVQTMKHLGKYQRMIGKSAYMPSYSISYPKSAEPHLSTRFSSRNFLRRSTQRLCLQKLFHIGESFFRYCSGSCIAAGCVLLKRVN